MNVLAVMLSLLVQAPETAHRAVYDKASDSIVAVRATPALGERSGSGVIVSKDGFIITSYATCPEGSENIRVYLRGPRLLKAKLVATDPEHELSLIKVEIKAELTPIEYGEAVKLGDASYTLGNAANSIINNDSASLGVGIVSAQYTLRDPHGTSIYVGPVIETTAPVNVGMEGSPLLNSKGQMVGFVTLNYSPSRFLGNAIPVASIRAAIEKLQKRGAAVAAPTPDGEAGPGYLGVTVADRNGKVVVESVDAGSPAEEKGLAKGLVLVALGGRPIKDAADFRTRQQELKEGDVIFLKVDDEGSVANLKIPLGKRKGK
jgi:serine protease Do